MFLWKELLKGGTLIVLNVGPHLVRADLWNLVFDEQKSTEAYCELLRSAVEKLYPLAHVVATPSPSTELSAQDSSGRREDIETDLRHLAAMMFLRAGAWLTPAKACSIMQSPDTGG